MYKLVQKSHKKCTNWYKLHNMYEFVLVNLYTKISKKKICIRVGISTRDQYPRLKSSCSAIHHPAPSVVAIFLYTVE